MLWSERSAGPRSKVRLARRQRGLAARVAATVLVLGVTAAACGDDAEESDANAVATTIAGEFDSAEATTNDNQSSPISTMEPGDITQTVPTGVQSTAAPVGLDETAVAGSNSVTITSIESVETEGQLPGEVAGPGVAVTIEFDNGSSEQVSLAGVVVDLVDANGLSATPINAGTEPFAGTLEAGATQSATYVFAIDESLRRDVTIHLSYAADEPIVLFTGDIA